MPRSEVQGGRWARGVATAYRKDDKGAILCEGQCLKETPECSGRGHHLTARRVQRVAKQLGNDIKDSQKIGIPTFIFTLIIFGLWLFFLIVGLDNKNFAIIFLFSPIILIPIELIILSSLYSHKEKIKKKPFIMYLGLNNISICLIGIQLIFLITLILGIWGFT